MKKCCYEINTLAIDGEYLIRRINDGINYLKTKVKDGKLSIECGIYAANKLKELGSSLCVHFSPMSMCLEVFGIEVNINKDLISELLIITIRDEQMWLSTSMSMYKRPFFEEFISDELRLQEANVRKELMKLGNNDKWKKMQIKDVIFNAPATIVLWNDGTKTVVKCQDGETFDKEKGLAMALVKKACGNVGNFNELFKKWC